MKQGHLTYFRMVHDNLLDLALKFVCFIIVSSLISEGKVAAKRAKLLEDL